MELWQGSVFLISVNVPFHYNDAPCLAMFFVISEVPVSNLGQTTR